MMTANMDMIFRAAPALPTNRGDHGTRRQTRSVTRPETFDVGASSVTTNHTAQIKTYAGEELFALRCPLRMRLALGVEAARTEDGIPTTRVLVDFLEGSCNVTLLRSNVGAINLGPVIGFQAVINNIIIPSLIAIVNEVPRPDI
jgi:hypothetical protein